MEKAEVKRRMTYVRPNQDRLVRHSGVTEVCIKLGEELLGLCHEHGRDFAVAMTKLEEVRMWANSAIAHEASNE